MACYLERDAVDEFIYIHVADESNDNWRFLKECEGILGREITRLQSEEYQSVEQCVRTFGGFKHAGNGFAPCTNWLKRRVRTLWEMEHPDYALTYVWGFDAKEKDRADKTEVLDPDHDHIFPLIERNLSKEEVHGMYDNLFGHIEKPVMYRLGYPNNNCIGCVKGGMGYWNKIREDFPQVFESRAKLEREVGYSMLKDEKGPVYLDELDPDRGRNTIIVPDCSIACYMATLE